MILYPAIDLKDGECVRVVHGDFATATVFNKDPADQARAWARAGFEWVHVVDLNGSAEGRAINDAAVKAILEAVSIPVVVNGDIRNSDDAENALSADELNFIAAGTSGVVRITLRGNQLRKAMKFQ